MAFSAQKFSASGAYRPQSDINVTPLVDVMLVLLVIFMVTAPLMAQGVKVNLPQAQSSKPLDSNAPLIVNIEKSGEISLGANPVSINDLSAALRKYAADHSDYRIHVRGDQDTPYGLVITVLDRLSQEGITKIAIVTTPKIPRALERAP